MNVRIQFNIRFMAGIYYDDRLQLNEYTVKVYFQASPIWDILLFGAIPNINDIDVAKNNCTRINNAIKDSSKSGSGIISIPKGIFYLMATSTYCISILRGNTNDMSNVKIIGEGIGVSVLQLYQNPDNKKTIFNIKCNVSGTIDNVEFYDLSILGNNNTYEQAHCVLVFKSAKMIFSNVEFAYQGGDGIKIVGNEDNSSSIEYSHDITIENCKFHHNNRNGITVQYGACKMIINNNLFEENEGDIDMEPTSNIGITTYSIIISNNNFTRATPKGLSISLSGKNNIESKNIEQKFILSNNNIVNGSIWAYMCKDVIVANNYISGGDGYAFQAVRRIKNFVFNNNIVINNGIDNSSSPNGSDFRQYSLFLAAENGLTIENINITGNQFINAGCGFENCHDVSLTNNTIKALPVVNNGIALRISSIASDFGFDDYGNISINGNQITQEYGAGLVAFSGIIFTCNNIGTEYRYNNIRIDDNIIDAPELAHGIQINQIGVSGSAGIVYWERLQIGKGNRIGNCSGIPIDVETNSYLTGMNPTGNQWISEGTPENHISGQQGTTAIDKTREADNKYQLNTIDGNTGWTLLSEMGRQVLFEDDFQDIQPLSVTPFYIDDQTKHKPNIWVQGNTWVAPSSLERWSVKTLNGKKLASAESLVGGKAIATVSVTNDAEIKALFQTDQFNNWIGGLVFRHASSSSYWQYNLRRTSGINTLELLAPGSSASLLSTYPPVVLGDSGIFELKVLLKGTFVSVFFNDLLVLNLNSGANITSAEHGIITNTISAIHLSCQSFKIFLR